MSKKKFQIVFTMVWTLFYCLLWIALEWVVYGKVQNSLVDNVIMVMFIPVIWLAMDASYEDLKAYHKKNDTIKG